MSRCYKYAVARFSAHRLRGERLNIGLVVLKNNVLDVRLPKSLDKLHAISGALDIGLVREVVEQLPNLYSYIVTQEDGDNARLSMLAELSAVDFSPAGELTVSSEAQYEEQVGLLVTNLVEPEPAPPRVVRSRHTKLLADVKTAFRSERVLARKGEGLEAHRIVANHKIAEGLPADLILKNGALHIIETVDATQNDILSMRLIYSIAKSALVFEQARMQFGTDGTKPRLVYKASSSLESFISPSLEAAEHQGATLVNWESRDDRVRFVVELSSLAQPVADLGKAADQRLHASIQPKFKLN